MAKDQIVKTKSNDVSEGGVGVASTDAVSVEVELSTMTANGKQQLRWGKERGDVTDVSYTVSDACGEAQGCANSLTNSHGHVVFHTLVKPGAMARIDAAVTYSGATDPVHCKPMIVSAACGGKSCNITMCVPSPPSQSIATRTAQLVIDALWRTRDGDREEEGPQIAAVHAKVIPSFEAKDPATAGSSSPRPVVRGSRALLELVRDQTYEVMAEFREDYAGACPPFPMDVHVCWEGTRELRVFLERCERMVALFFVDTCGRPVVPRDVLRDGQVLPMAVSQEGVCSFRAEKPGRVRLSSQDCEFRPNEIDVDERMKQGHVIEALAKTHALTGSTTLEEIVLEFAEEIKEGERAFFKIMKLDGQLIETLEAGSGRAVYSPLSDEPLMIHALRNGKVIDQVMHHLPK